MKRHSLILWVALLVSVGSVAGCRIDDMNVGRAPEEDDRIVLQAHKRNIRCVYCGIKPLQD